MASTKILKPQRPPKLDRLQGRLDIRRSDGLKSFILLNEQQQIEVYTYDLSPFGACLLVSNDNHALFTRQTHVEVKIELKKGTAVRFLAEVCWKSSSTDKGVRIGIKFLEQTFPFASLAPLKSKDFPVKLPDYFSVTGAFYKPFLFFERTMFRVTSISERIWEIKIFDSEIILYKGLKLDLYLISSDLQSQPLKGEVITFQKGEQHSIICQMRIDGINPKLREWLSRQLVFVCELSPVTIKRVGLESIRLSNGFRFRFAKTQEEYEEVLKLRFKAYREAGKIDESKSFRDMVAPLDHLSRILIAKHGEKIVASVSISFPNNPSMLLDTERAFPGGYPQPVPSKTDVVEIARLCTDSDYRRTDLLNRMFEYTYKVTICGDRKYIITSTDKKLWPLYRKLGFKKTGMSYPHPYLSGIEHQVIIGERTQPDFASNISPFAWNYLWRDMNFFLEEKGLIHKNFSQQVWTSFIATLGRMFRINTHSKY